MVTLLKSVLITGCSANGIGAGLAEVFQEKGYHVFATLRNPAKIPSSLAKSTNVTVLNLDVLSSESIAAAVESVKQETNGKLDVLINNSGAVLVAPGLDTKIEQGKELFNLNFWAPMAMLQAFAPLLIEAKGCVVNNTSANSVAPFPLMRKSFTQKISSHLLTSGLGMYNGSKAAFAMASETWRLELQPLGVRTITLITLAVKTNALKNHQSIEIPETSYYYRVRDFIYGRTDGSMQEGAVTPRQYATKVVREVEKGTSVPVWAGAHASTGRWGWWLSPQFVKVSCSFPSMRRVSIKIVGHGRGKCHSPCQRDGQS
jgi:1-acylglycerone phosphate reductase